MAYLIKFKNKFTGQKWISQKHLFDSVTKAKRTKKYLDKNNTDEKSKSISQTVKIIKVDARKAPYKKMSIH